MHDMTAYKIFSSSIRRWSSKMKLIRLQTYIILFVVCIFPSIYIYSLYLQMVNGFDFEVSQILKHTPYLWRRFNLGNGSEHSSRGRIQAQQDWIRNLSQTKWINGDKAKPKLIWIEDDISKFHWPDGKVHCPYAPSFEQKCRVEKISPMVKLLDDPYHLMEGDAIVSVRDWDMSEMVYHIPNYMLHVIHIVEPPHITQNASLGATNALISSYWRGSDIPSPYYVFIPTKDNVTTVPVPQNIIKSKTKLAVAMISSCTQHDRVEYIAELQKFMSVDFYGKCGTMTCPNNKNCFNLFEAKYKFYLAFENSRCEDYITEKLFLNALGYYIVPVVRGPRKSDYLSAAPPNSFIHVDDFESIQELAKYLSYLDQNDDAYLKYFEWKGSGTINNNHFHDMFCRICAMLYYAQWVPPPIWESKKIEWKDINVCLSSDKARWTD